MMQNFIKLKASSIAPLASLDRIERFEDWYRIKLPDSYLKFLEYANCGIPDSVCSLIVGERERVIERFLCILDNPNSEPEKGGYDISVVITQLEDRLTSDENLVGMDIIPIAALFGGDFVCLDYRENKGDPKVVVWDHEQSDELSPVTELVANSFDEFLELLKRH